MLLLLMMTRTKEYSTVKISATCSCLQEGTDGKKTPACVPGGCRNAREVAASWNAAPKLSEPSAAFAII